jgi:hypothetical protein
MIVGTYMCHGYSHFRPPIFSPVNVQAGEARRGQPARCGACRSLDRVLGLAVMGASRTGRVLDSAQAEGRGAWLR